MVVTHVRTYKENERDGADKIVKEHGDKKKGATSSTTCTLTAQLHPKVKEVWAHARCIRPAGRSSEPQGISFFPFQISSWENTMPGRGGEKNTYCVYNTSSTDALGNTTSGVVYRTHTPTPKRHRAGRCAARIHAPRRPGTKRIETGRALPAKPGERTPGRKAGAQGHPITGCVSLAAGSVT